MAVPSTTVLAWRVTWAFAIFFGLLIWRGRLRELPAALASSLGTFALSALLISINWFVYLYCVLEGLILQASLGYFINPLVNVVLGMAFLRERLRPAQWIAVVLAASGVLLLWRQTATFPWLSLLLAGSFGLYGLVRKTARADALLGSNLETGLLLPLSLGWMLFAAPPEGPIVWTEATWSTRLLLIGGGALTALPLLWFSNAARRLPYSTLGFFQYLAPTGQFLLAVAVYKEPFSTPQLISFTLIWLALAVFMTEARLDARRRRRAQALTAGPDRAASQS